MPLRQPQRRQQGAMPKEIVEAIVERNPGSGMLLRISAAAPLAGPGISTRTLYSWVEKGIVPEDVVLRAGRAIYIRRDPFLAWLGAKWSETKASDGAGMGDQS